MSENIVGYTDRVFVKGNFYRTAGCPIPISFTGNIDTDIDELLVRAATVYSGTSTGTFPTSLDTYYLETIEYGNNVFVQKAISVSTKTEYIRIMSNDSWGEWFSSSDKIKNIEGKLDTLEKENLPARVAANEGNIQKNSGDIISLGTSLNQTETRLRNEMSSKIKQITISQKVTMKTKGEVNNYFQLAQVLNYPSQNALLIGMTTDTSSISAINGTVYMVSHAPNGARPYVNYQKGANVTFENVMHNFTFTFFVP